MLQLLPIPALHQDMALPGGQAYMDAAAAMLRVHDSMNRDSGAQWATVNKTLTMVHASLRAWGICFLQQQQQQQECKTVLLSATAVRLLLELQLLAAGTAQQFQKQQQQPSARRAALELLTNCNSVLGTQILFSLNRHNPRLPAA